MRENSLDAVRFAHLLGLGQPRTVPASARGKTIARPEQGPPRQAESKTRAAARPSFLHLLAAERVQDVAEQSPATRYAEERRAEERQAKAVAARIHAAAEKARNGGVLPKPPPAGSPAAQILAAAERARTGTTPAPLPKGSAAAQIIAAGKKRRGEV